MGRKFEPLSDVPLTAYLTAVARREATDNLPSVLSDPYAARFAERCPPSILRMTRRTAGRSVLVERSLVIDSVLSAVISTSAVSCVLNIGAGFDARPYRMCFDRPVMFAELDLAAVIEEKERLLPASQCPFALRRFSCDLRDAHAVWAAVNEVADEGPVLVLTEGLLSYLPPADVRNLARLLGESMPVENWICDVMSVRSAGLLEATARAAGLRGLRMYGFDSLADLEEHGWECVEYRILKTASLTSAPISAQMPAASSRILDGVLHLKRRAELLP